MIYIHRVSSATLIVAAILLFFVSCSDSGTGSDDSGLTQDQQNVIQYFKEVSLGFEFGSAPEITRKWDQDIVVFVGGEENTMLRSELDIVVGELNNLISEDNVEITVTADSTEAVNYYVFFGTGEEYAEIEPRAQNFVDSNFGLFFVNTSTTTNHIVRGTMYVDTYRPAPQQQRHLLREELTQSLGMAKDSARYSDSIFNSNFSVAVTEFSKYDEAVIQLLYHPSMSTGLDAAGVDSVLREIIGDIID